MNKYNSSKGCVLEVDLEYPKELPELHNDYPLAPDNSNKLVVGKMKDKTAGVVIEEFVELKPKIYSYLVNYNSEHKKAKVVNRNVVATIRHNEDNDVLFNKKCLRHSMNRIQSKDHRIGTYDINKISFSCFDDKIHIQSNGCDGLAIDY